MTEEEKKKKGGFFRRLRSLSTGWRLTIQPDLP